MLDLAGLTLSEALSLLEAQLEGRALVVTETSGYRSEEDSAEASEIRVLRITETSESLTVLTARF